MPVYFGRINIMNVKFFYSPFLLVFIVKLAYIAMFYSAILGNYNIGDTAAYVDQQFIDRMDYASPAYLLSLISSLLGGRTWVVDIAFAYITFLVLKNTFNGASQRDRWLVVCAFASPLSLLYVTVFSKEVFVFWVVLLAFYTGRYKYFGWLFAIYILAWLKPPFLIFFVYCIVLNSTEFFRKLIIRVSFPNCILYLIFCLLILMFSKNVIEFYDDAYLHFYYGRMSYSSLPSEALEMLMTINFRMLLIEGITIEIENIVIFASFYLLVILQITYSYTRLGRQERVLGLNMLLVAVFSAFPYSLFNPGSYSRYVSPLLLALFFGVYLCSSHAVHLRQARLRRP